MRITMNSIYDYFRKNKRNKEDGHDEDAKEFESKEDQFIERSCVKLQEKETKMQMLINLISKIIPL